MRALLRMVVKELHQLRQDKKMIPMLIAMPLVQLVLLGYAANLDVREIPLVVVDRSHSAASRDLIQRFTETDYFRLVGVEQDVGELDRWLLEGDAQIALVVGEGYAEQIAAGRTPELLALADGTDSISSGLGLAYAGGISASVGEELVRREVQRVQRMQRAQGGMREATAAGGGPGAIELRPKVLYNPDLESRWFYAPAILAMVLMIVTMVLPSMAIVREKEIGTLEQISVTPLKPWQMIVGKLLPFAGIGVLDLLLVSAVVILVFGVPLNGTLAALIVLSIPFLLTCLGLGLLFSTLVHTQQQAMMAAAFLGMLPMIYLSGLIFPIDSMPPPAQKITYAIPLRYYAVIIRGVFLKGAGFAVLWPQALALCAFAAGSLVLATLRFNKSLD
jgi:ABC-2 type transport system permease protein